MMSRSRTSLIALSPWRPRPLLAAALGVERLDHLVGDVHLRAPEDRLLQDEVVLLGLEDLLDDTVGPLDDRRQFLVLALAEVLLELAAAPLQIAVLVDEFALAARPLGLAERGGVLVEPIARRLQLVRELVEVLLALRELRLELGLGSLRRRSVAQHAIAVDVADLQLLRRSRRARAGDERGGEQRFDDVAVHQKAVPI